LAESEERSIDFEPVREVWNKYKLENNVILRNRISLSRIASIPKKENQVGYHYELEVSTEMDTPVKVSIESILSSPPIVITQVS
jgi:hypothetical protein